MLTEFGLEHCLDDTMKSLYVPITAGLSTELNQNPPKIISHPLNLLFLPTIPHIGSLNIPVYPFKVVTFATSSRIPPFAEFSFTKNSVTHKLLQLEDRVDSLSFSNIAYDGFGTFLGFFVAVQCLMKAKQIAEMEVVQKRSQFIRREERYFAFSRRREEVRQAHLSAGSRFKHDELSRLVIFTLQHNKAPDYILIRKIMYFKQRENSPLYQHYQKIEHQRLSKRLQQIRSQKVRTRDQAERLPPITHRPSDNTKIYQKKMVLAETDRLNKKIHQLKTHRSTYFSKVIGLNLSMDLTKSKRTPMRQATQQTLNISTMEKTESREE